VNPLLTSPRGGGRQQVVKESGGFPLPLGEARRRPPCEFFV